MTSAFEHMGVVNLVADLIAQGRVPADKRTYWETRLLRDPGAIRELHLEREPVFQEPPAPARDQNASVSKSSTQQFQEWVEEQHDLLKTAPGPAPSCPSFRSPSSSASGIELSTILSLPWKVRHRVASEPDRAEAQRLVEIYSGKGGEIEAEIAAEIAAASGGPGFYEVMDYTAAVEAWASDPRVPFAEAERATAPQASEHELSSAYADYLELIEQAKASDRLWAEVERWSA